MSKLRHIAITVPDLEKAAVFYEKTFGMTRARESEIAIPLEIKVQHEDFRVQELCSFTPSGDGEHLFLMIEKRGQTTPDVARHLARHYDVELKDVGHYSAARSAAVKIPEIELRSFGSIPLACRSRP